MRPCAAGGYRRIPGETEIQNASVRHCTYFDSDIVCGIVYSSELNEVYDISVL